MYAVTEDNALISDTFESILDSVLFIVPTLKKDPDNCYDDEAIVACDKHGCKCGYVANSVSTVARGTYSAGRVYDRIPDEEKCIIRFITEECLIGEISPLLTQNEQEEDDDGING